MNKVARISTLNLLCESLKLVSRQRQVGPSLSLEGAVVSVLGALGAVSCGLSLVSCK